ncbi:MAG: hypothetical protein U1F65_12030 [Verrucomicrobiota bacterium]
MLIRISLIVAIIAGLAVGALNFITVKQKVNTLQTNLKTETEEHQKFENQYRSTKKSLDNTTAQLTQTNFALVASWTERDKAVADREMATKHAADLSEKLAKTSKERDDAKDELAAFQAAGMTPAQVLNASKEIKSLQENVAGAHDENLLLAKKISKLDYELQKYRGTNVVVFLPETVKGKVVVADPKWDFIVVDVGENQGVKQDGELLVSRGGKLVAKVIVRSIQKDRCIANVIPGWKLGELLEGDQVIPAHPAS